MPNILHIADAELVPRCWGLASASVEIVAPLTSCATMDKLLNISGLHCPLPCTSVIRLLGGLHEMIHETLAAFGAPRKWSCECETLLLNNCWMNGSGSCGFLSWGGGVEWRLLYVWACWLRSGAFVKLISFLVQHRILRCLKLWCLFLLLPIYL